MAKRYYLESSGKDAHLPRYLHLETLPAIVGRHSDCNLQLGVDHISRKHARFDLDGEELTIEDLGSTNGTFVNHEQVSGLTRLNVGDVVHLADHEFRLMVDNEPPPPQKPTGDETMVGMATLPKDFPLKMPAFFELMDNGSVCGHCQPIVTAAGEPFALELLGRGAHPSLDGGPGELFALAAALECEVRLSRLFRRTCFAEASSAGIDTLLFFNNHPAECEDIGELLDELGELRELYPDLNLVFEVHEAAVTDLGAMAEVKQELKRMKIGLAYDDFGAGQARLLELAEVPPDFLKFDMGLIKNMSDRESPRYRLLDSLNSMIADMGVKTLIEGVEDERTVALCREIGLDYMQGFYFGRPVPILER